MNTLLAILTGGVGPLVVIGGAIIAGILALLGIRHSGVKAGKAQAQEQARDHVDRSVAQQAQVDQSASRLGDDAARDRVLDKYSRP